MGKIKKIHFTGVKGVGMAALAIIAKEAGFIVTGSDVSEKFITDEELIKAGVIIYEGFNPSRVDGVDLVITTSAHGGSQNIEVKTAKDKGIAVISQGEALGKFQSGQIMRKDFTAISVAGSHGKTTTSAMIATMLKGNKLDPSYAIGTGNIPSLGNSGHFGKGKYFVVEADEYFADEAEKIPKFLYQKPNFIVVTNIDFDHPDIYESINEVRNAFLKFTGNLVEGGALIVCGDGEENRKFLKEVTVKKITYGMSPDNNYWIERVNYSSEKMFFWIKNGENVLGQFSVNVFGEQNALDALASIVLGLELGLSIEQVKNGLSRFQGTKRRSEFIGFLVTGAKVYDDYAHHPREIKETLASFRKAFPREKLIVIYQPHMYSRTKILFNEFASAFIDANEVIMTEIFPSFREQIDKSFSSRLLVDEIKKFGASAIYSPDLTSVVKYLVSRKLDKNTVLITMGAGDIYKVGKELIDG